MKKSSLALNSSASGAHQFSQGSRHLQLLRCSQIQKMGSTLSSRSNSKLNCLNRSSSQKLTKATAVVMDDDGNDVTPMALYNQTQEHKSKSNFLEEIFSSSGTDYTKSTSSFNVLPFSSVMGSSRQSSLSTKVTDESPKLYTPVDPSAPCKVLKKRENVKQDMTEEMWDEVVDIYLSEPVDITLLDIPSTLMSEDADDAEAVKKKNVHYDELCKNRMGNDKFVARPMQTFSGAPKSKQIQSESIVMVAEDTMATKWDIYDSFFDQNKTLENERADYPESIVNISKGQNMRVEMSSSTSTVGTDSAVSSLLYCSDTEMCGNSSDAEPSLHPIMLSESFKHSLLVMESSIVADIFQPKLAIYRQLAVLEDPDSKVEPRTEEQSEDGEESFSSSPALKHLWTFSCKLTRQCNITCMTWNKENPDFLAVGHGDYDSSSKKPSLICCWSLKNPTWPQCVFQCHSCVTSLDFSAYNPGQLAVGMYDGTVAIYDVWRQCKNACVASSSECNKKHLKPVWQVTWRKKERGGSGDQMVEVLVSVSADGRISEWLQSSSGLDCIDLMKPRRTEDRAKKAAGNKKTQTVLSVMSPALCVDFHPTDSSIYLAGTGEGFIHKCSFTNSEHYLDTYQKHLCPVNHIEWSPFCPDVFLSCSSDWTIQLWKEDRLTPVLSLTHAQKAVCAARWSPNWSTVFATINEQQVEIWDLKSSILHPTIVHHTAPGVKMTSLLFAKGIDCVLVGDNDGQVTVFQLTNLSVGEGKQATTLEDIIQFAESK